MRPLHFSTGTVPPEQRLDLFRLGARAYQVDTPGDPLAFAADWRVLALGDANAVHAHVSPLIYRRTRERIAADGENRLVFFHIRQGRSIGMLDDRPVLLGPGDAMIWDLSCPLEMHSPDGVETEVVTLPRFMVDEVMPGATLSGVIPASPALTLVVEHFHFLFDRAGDLPDEAAPFQGRALRDMLAMAMQPLYRTRVAGADEWTGPVLQRIIERIDHDLRGMHDPAALATGLSLTVGEVVATLTRFGGVDGLVEQRRLLAAYRLLSNPAETGSVSVIADRCGFTDMPHFSRRFRAVFHTTASDLRLHHRAHLPVWAGAYHIERNYGAMVVGDLTQA